MVHVLTFCAFLFLLPTTTLTLALFCFKVITVGHCTRSPSGEKAVWKGMLRLPGTVPRLYLIGWLSEN